MLEEIKKYKEQKEQLRKLIVENDELYKQIQTWRDKKWKLYLLIIGML